VSWTSPDGVTAIATVISTLIVILAAVFAFHQLREMARARSAEAVVKIFEMMIDDVETRSARRYVRTHELPRPGKASEETFAKMYRVWVSFDNLGIMVFEGLLPERIPMEMFHTSVIECWEKLAPHIDHERNQRGKRYQVFFEDLYCRSLRYQRKHYRDQQDTNPMRLLKVSDFREQPVVNRARAGGA
jgi:hypothetical protein